MTLPDGKEAATFPEGETEMMRPGSPQSATGDEPRNPVR